MKKERGFTLLETVIAIGILVVVGGIAVGASTQAINSGTYSKDRTKAMELARRQMEDLKVMRDTNYKDQKPETPWSKELDKCLRQFGFVEENGKVEFDVGCTSQKVTIDNQVFTVGTMVEKVDDDFNGSDDGVIDPEQGTNPQNGYAVELDEKKNMRRTIVTVTWEEGFPAGNREVKLVSYITNDVINR